MSADLAAVLAASAAAMVAWTAYCSVKYARGIDVMAGTFYALLAVVNTASFITFLIAMREAGT